MKLKKIKNLKIGLSLLGVGVLTSVVAVSAVACSSDKKNETPTSSQSTSKPVNKLVTDIPSTLTAGYYYNYLPNLAVFYVKNTIFQQMTVTSTLSTTENRDALSKILLQ